MELDMEIKEFVAYKEGGIEGIWVRITEECAKCGEIDRTLYLNTNSTSDLKIFWHSSSPRKLKCHKARAIETFTEGDELRDEVNNLSPNDRAKYVGTMNF